MAFRGLCNASYIQPHCIHFIRLHIVRLNISFLEEKIVLYIILSALNYLIWIIVVLIFLRSILSWFPGGSESKTGSILFTLTEPILGPIRRVFMKFEFARSSPFDFSPVVAILLLFLLQTIISIIAMI